MSFHGFYTTKGLTLAAKIAAGTKLTITKVTAGSGETAKTAATLAQEQQTLTAGTAAVSGQNAVLPVTLAETGVSAAYSLTELGVYAQDPDAGEILYQVFRLDKPVPLTAGGENAYRFYLKQTVGAAGITVTCSPAGLLTDGDLAPVREKVMAISAPERTVTLAPSDVGAYLKALPRMLTEALTIKVTAGTVPETLRFSGFYGPGNIYLTTASGGKDVTLANGVSSAYSCAVIEIANMKITGGTSYEKAAVLNTWSSPMVVNDCDLTAGESAAYGIYSNGGSLVTARDCSISGYTHAVLAQNGAKAVLNNITASGNTYGGYVWGGGTILLCGSTPETLGGSTNNKSGGMIVKKDGTLL
mgnify:CR=1 FL=1